MDGLRAILGTDDRKWQALQTQQGSLENRHSANSYKVLPHATGESYRGQGALQQRGWSFVDFISVLIFGRTISQGISAP